MRRPTVFSTPTQYAPQSDTKLPKQNFLDALTQYGTRIMATGSTTSDLSIYVVPPGKYFFLVTATLSFVGRNGSTEVANLYVGGSGGVNNYIIRLIGYSQTNATNYDFVAQPALSLNPAIPIRFISLENFHVATSGIAQAIGTIIGYEIDSSLLPLFN